MAELIDIDPYYLELSNTAKERCQRYREDVNKIMKEDFLHHVRKSLDEGIFGRKSFIETMRERFKITSLNPVGRPKKIQKS